MSAVYYLPKDDITTQELAIIMGFVTIGLINNIEQRKEKIKRNLQDNYPPVRIADRSGLNLNKTFILDESLYNSMPANLKRHFSFY